MKAKNKGENMQLGMIGLEPAMRYKFGGHVEQHGLGADEKIVDTGHKEK